MATVLEHLQAVNSYPISGLTLEGIASRRGLLLTEEFDANISQSRSYNLALADLFDWLSLAPNVSQGGQSYSFTDEQRLYFRNEALRLYRMYGELTEAKKSTFGYKGQRL